MEKLLVFGFWAMVLLALVCLALGIDLAPVLGAIVTGL